MNARHLFFPFPRMLCAVLPIFVTGLFLAGCNGSASDSSDNTNSGSNSESQKNSITSDLLGSAVSVLDIENLGVTASTDAGISRINQAFSNSTEITEQISESIEQAGPVWQKLLTPQEQELASGQMLTHRDGKHLWDALLSQKLALISIGEEQDELNRVVNAFNFLNRNLSLTTRHPSELPLTLQEIWTIGRATAEDRAWAFASLLRQLDIDCVLLFPAAAATAENPPFLIAVLLNDQAYLFDPRLGLPIPGAEPQTPVATLAEVISHPEVLTRLSVDDEHPYPITGESLKQPQVKLIGNTSSWAPRLSPVESSFLGERRLSCYNGLHDDQGRPGYLSRVISAGQGLWIPDDITVWKYPESQLAGSEQMSIAQQDALRALKDSWKASWQDDIETPIQTGGFSASARSQFAARLWQLTGQYNEAVRLYVQIGKTNRELEQLQNGEFVPQLFPQKTNSQQFSQGIDAEQQKKEQFNVQFNEIMNLQGAQRRDLLQMLLRYHSNNIRQHKSAARDAEYWVGVCQYESGKITAAKNTFQRYLDQTPNGVWAAGCRYYLAVIQADAGDYAAAAEILSKTSPADPAYAGHHVLSRLWKQRSDKKTPAE